MTRPALYLLLLPCLMCACTSTGVLNPYENDELVAVHHNQQTDCTLMIYRDPMGQTRHIFRKHGVFELGLTFTLDGSFVLKERGRPERTIESTEALGVTQHIDSMVRVPELKERSGHLSNTVP